MRVSSSDLAPLQAEREAWWDQCCARTPRRFFPNGFRKSDHCHGYASSSNLIPGDSHSNTVV